MTDKATTRDASASNKINFTFFLLTRSDQDNPSKQIGVEFSLFSIHTMHYIHYMSTICNILVRARDVMFSVTAMVCVITDFMERSETYQVMLCSGPTPQRGREKVQSSSFFPEWYRELSILLHHRSTRTLCRHLSSLHHDPSSLRTINIVKSLT